MILFLIVPGSPISYYFQPNLSILGFCTTFTQSGYVQWKIEKVNITIEFFIFELV